MCNKLCSSSEKLAARRATERREQYRQVRAHVKKNDGRLWAYGWSVPAKVSASGSSSAETQQTSNSICQSSNRQPPVPVYCRPLTENEPEMKVGLT